MGYTIVDIIYYYLNSQGVLDLPHSKYFSNEFKIIMLLIFCNSGLFD